MLVWARFRCSAPMVQKVLLVVPVVAFVGPFHMRMDISFQDIGGSSLASYLVIDKNNKTYVSDQNGTKITKIPVVQASQKNPRL